MTEPRRGLVIAGPPDAGKTTAASWLGSQEPSAADLRFWKPRTGQPVVVFVAAEFLLGAYHARGRERDPITGRNLLDLLSCWLLIVDETYPSTLAQTREPEFRFPLQTGIEELTWGNVIPDRAEQESLLRGAGFTGEIQRSLIGEGFTVLAAQR